MSRDRGDVYIYNFPDPIGAHRVVIVSRPTNRATVLVAFITTTSQPVAPDVVPLTDRECFPTVKGFVRCDQLYPLDVASRDWVTFVMRLSEADMAFIDAGLRAALAL